MTHYLSSKQIDGLAIGRAFMWETHDDGVADYAEERARAYRVTGLPDDTITAYLVPAQGRGWWGFLIMTGDGQTVRSDDSYESKEEAMVGLKAWLRRWRM